MNIKNIFAKARNANYMEPLCRPVVVTDVPEDISKLAIASGMSESLVLSQKTKWLDGAALDALDAAIDQAPFARIGQVCDVKKVVGPHGIYGEDVLGRKVASCGIYRVPGGALVEFGYM